MTKVTIDSTEYDVPRLKFKTLKQVYPIVVEAQGSDNPMTLASATVQVLSLAMIKAYPDMTVDWLDENMDAGEVRRLDRFMVDVMKDAGLLTDEDEKNLLGEAQGATDAPTEAADLSTGTLTPSSQNSLPPDVAGPIGT